MELTVFMDKCLGSKGGISVDRFPDYGVASRTFDSMAKGNSAVAWSLGATSFWQAFIDSPSFAKTLGPAVTGADRFLVCHGSHNPRLDLLVFDPEHNAS